MKFLGELIAALIIAFLLLFGFKGDELMCDISKSKAQTYERCLKLGCIDADVVEDYISTKDWEERYCEV